MLPIQCLECPSLPAPLNWSQGSPVQSLSLACCLQLSHSYNPGSPVLKKKEQAKRESVILNPTPPNQVLVTNLIIVSASPRNIILNQSI